MIDTKRIKLQTNPPGSRQQAPIRQAPRVPGTDARRPAKLAPVAYDAADAPPAPATPAALLEQLAAQLGMRLVPTEQRAEPKRAEPKAAEPKAAEPKAAEQYPDPRAIEADNFVDELSRFVDDMAPNLSPDQRAELEQIKDGFAKFVHALPAPADAKA